MSHESWPTDPTGTGTSADPERPPSVGALLATLSGQVSTLVQGEIELTKSKATTFFKKVGAGGALLAVAGVLALYLIGWVLHTIEVAIAVALPAWAAALIVMGILLIAVATLALVGVKLIQKGQQDPPKPQDGIKQDVNAFKKGLGK